MAEKDNAELGLGPLCLFHPALVQHEAVIVADLILSAAGGEEAAAPTANCVVPTR